MGDTGHSCASYYTSEQALDSMSLGLAAEIHRFGIRVSLICPAAYETGVGNNFWVPGTDSDEPSYRQIAGNIVLRWKEDAANKDPVDVASAIVDAVHTEEPPIRYLVDDDARSAYALHRGMSDDEWVEQMAALGDRVGLGCPRAKDRSGAWPACAGPPSAAHDRPLAEP